MVDRVARARATQLLRNFISGKVTNDEFEDGCPQTQDRAIHAIWETAWVLYDDLSEHRLTGQHRLTTDMRRICVRWLLFLYSDLDYEWPDIRLPGIDPATRIQQSRWRRLLGFPQAAVTSEVADKFLASGHYPVWPFASIKNYRQALLNPRLLSGARAQ